MLVKTLVSAVLHHPRIGIGEVVLIFVLQPRCGGLGWRPRGLRFSCRAQASRACT